MLQFLKKRILKQNRILNIRIIYVNGTDQSSMMNEIGNYIKYNFKEFDYIISIHVIRYVRHRFSLQHSIFIQF